VSFQRNCYPEGGENALNVCKILWAQDRVIYGPFLGEGDASPLKGEGGEQKINGIGNGKGKAALSISIAMKIHWYKMKQLQGK